MAFLACHFVSFNFTTQANEKNQRFRGKWLLWTPLPPKTTTATTRTHHQPTNNNRSTHIKSECGKSELSVQLWHRSLPKTSCFLGVQEQVCVCVCGEHGISRALSYILVWNAVQWAKGSHTVAYPALRGEGVHQSGGNKYWPSLRLLVQSALLGFPVGFVSLHPQQRPHASTLRLVQVVLAAVRHLGGWALRGRHHPIVVDDVIHLGRTVKVMW